MKLNRDQNNAVFTHHAHQRLSYRNNNLQKAQVLLKTGSKTDPLFEWPSKGEADKRDQPCVREMTMGHAILDGNKSLEWSIPGQRRYSVISYFFQRHFGIPG